VPPTTGLSGTNLGDPQVGGNIRWGVLDNLTQRHEIKPDFRRSNRTRASWRSIPRQALFFREAAFFLKGSRACFQAQNLIYTRRIVQPVAAVKLTGTTFVATSGPALGGRPESSLGRRHGQSHLQHSAGAT